MEQVQTVARPNKVLSVEDDADAQANLRDILELDGYLVESATSLKEALARSNWDEFSIILLDRRLPDGTTDTLLPRLKQLAPDAAVIILTGHADLESTLTALRHGASDYLLKPLNADVLRMTLSRLSKLREAEERAVQAERLAGIGQMLAVLSHESANALARAHACLVMLEEEVRDNPRALDLVQRLHKAQNDLRCLYQEVRSFAAPIALRRERVDVRDVWRQAWTSLAWSHSGKEATLDEHVDSVNTVCNIDAFRLEQVFRNLFENALAACPNAVRLSIECSEAVCQEQPAVRIAVRDNGPGMTAEERRRAFEAFYTTKSRGTGLGLAIARRIMEAHGGHIIATDTSGVGAEIVLVLPRANLAPANPH